MKSRLFGHSAKVALAILAVCGGLLTSCYEKDDVIGTPKYIIAGTITNTAGDPITGATVTIGGVAVSTSAHKFTKEVTYTTQAIPVVVSATSYVTYTTDVTLTKVEAGVSTETLNVVLVSDDTHDAHGGANSGGGSGK